MILNHDNENLNVENRMDDKSEDGSEELWSNLIITDAELASINLDDFELHLEDWVYDELDDID